MSVAGGFFGLDLVNKLIVGMLFRVWNSAPFFGGAADGVRTKLTPLLRAKKQVVNFM